MKYKTDITAASSLYKTAINLYQHLSDGIIHIDARNTIMALNPVAEKMLKWSHSGAQCS